MTDEELRALIASNAQAIQGNASAIAELGENIAQQGMQITQLRENIAQQGVQITQLRENITQQGEQMIQGISEVVAMVGELAAQQEARSAESDQRFNNLLADARADRQRADQNQAEAMQRIDQTLAAARADRERSDRDRAINEHEHRAFRETFQTLLAEVARIWQRLVG